MPDKTRLTSKKMHSWIRLSAHKERTELEFTVISQRIEADVQRIEWLA